MVLRTTKSFTRNPSYPSSVRRETLPLSRRSANLSPTTLYHQHASISTTKLEPSQSGQNGTAKTTLPPPSQRLFIPTGLAGSFRTVNALKHIAQSEFRFRYTISATLSMALHQVHISIFVHYKTLWMTPSASMAHASHGQRTNYEYDPYIDSYNGLEVYLVSPIAEPMLVCLK